MRTIEVSHLPSLVYTTRQAAEKEAKAFGVEACFITYKEGNRLRALGYGLYDGRLLEQKDFISV